MSIFLTFLEGVVSFVSPCMLPLLPVYVAYFAAEKSARSVVFLRALSFVFGFASVFVLLGVFAGTIGAALAAHRTAVTLVCGACIIVFGLGYLGFFRLPFSGGVARRKVTGFASAFVFGVVYSVSLTPCVGAFLGAALMQAASEGGALRGAVLLLAYSLGLGVPFVLSAMLLSRLSWAFGFIKHHYPVLNPLCGGFLVLFGAYFIWTGVRAQVRPASLSPSTASQQDSNAQREKESSMEVTLTASNFEAEVLKSEKAVLVDFWAPWCGPCRMLAPHLEELAKEKAATLKVGKVNVDEAPELAAKYGVMSIPALFLFKNGKVAAQSVGYLQKADLERFAAQ